MVTEASLRSETLCHGGSRNRSNWSDCGLSGESGDECAEEEGNIHELNNRLQAVDATCDGVRRETDARLPEPRSTRAR